MPKVFAKNFVLSVLSRLACKRLSPQTEIIGITGSVGKTTAKEAAAKILAQRFAVKASEKSFNSEFGLPLTLLEEKSGYSSALSWLGILLRSFLKSFTKLKADELILEMGVDAPGDMQKLLKIVQPKIGAVLAIKPVHLAEGQFKSLEEIATEKGQLIKSLSEEGTAILNADDPLVAQMETSAKKITFGSRNPADLEAKSILESLQGLSAEISWKNQMAKLALPILGKHNLTPILAAIAIGLTCGIELQDCLTALADFHLPPGRLSLLEGINNSKIIDGSYNANPASSLAALETLQSLETSGRKIVVLGQMNELGSDSTKLHLEIAKQLPEIADEIIGVFGDAIHFTKFAGDKNLPTHFFETAEEAGDYLKPKLKANDLVLVKGSQNNVRLEKCVKKILANPERDSSLLCRQGKEWGA